MCDKWSHLGGDLEGKKDKTGRYIDIRTRGTGTKIFISKEALKEALKLFDEERDDVR